MLEGGQEEMLLTDHSAGVSSPLTHQWFGPEKDCVPFSEIEMSLYILWSDHQRNMPQIVVLEFSSWAFVWNCSARVCRSRTCMFQTTVELGPLLEGETSLCLVIGRVNFCLAVLLQHCKHHSIQPQVRVVRVCSMLFQVCMGSSQRTQRGLKGHFQAK